MSEFLFAGVAEGEVEKLDTPLSFWGGFDVASGRIVDRSHPSYGVILTGRILAMPSGRGSSSSSSILAESIRIGTAPAGIVLNEADPILVVGAIVAQRLYGKSIPIVVYDTKLLQQADRVRINGQGLPHVQHVRYPSVQE